MSTVCTIARSNCANIKDFKANAGVGNMSTSIVGSLISTKNPAQNLQKCQRNRAPRVQLLMMYRLRVQNPALDQCRPSHLPVKLASNLRLGLLEVAAVTRTIVVAQQIVNRCLKFLKFCCEEEEELNFEVMDFSLCSPSLLFKLIDYLQEECKLGHGGRLGYIDAISELFDFRKSTVHRMEFL